MDFSPGKIRKIIYCQIYLIVTRCIRHMTAFCLTDVRQLTDICRIAEVNMMKRIHLAHRFCISLCNFFDGSRISRYGQMKYPGTSPLKILYDEIHTFHQSESLPMSSEGTFCPDDLRSFSGSCRSLYPAHNP